MPARVQVAASALTGRELEVLRLIGAGRTTREISIVLGVSRRTVENHKRRIFAKLDVQSQAHAVASAARRGLLTIPSVATGTPVVLGRPGELLDRLASMLCDPAATVPQAPPGSGRVAVLVDPSPEDWRVVGRLDARVVLVLSGELEETAVVRAFLHGADAVVPASRALQELIPVVELVGSGCTLIHPAHLRALIDLVRGQVASEQALSLTPREREILASIDRGESVKQTARSLGIAVKTVENLQGRLFRKLGVRNRAQAVAAAHTRGLLPAS
ncbi:MAG TPA: LuxR family transcriptional regulator [Actinomycetes bacterium]|nr:LuxR family transcriptional regulator [Actinomycetes bacterium]